MTNSNQRFSSFEDAMNEDGHYFSEGHLECWFKEKYQGETKKDIEALLRNEHDNSCEIENMEDELERELTDDEKVRLIDKFIKSVLSNINFKRGIAIGYYDSLGELNK